MDGSSLRIGRDELLSLERYHQKKVRPFVSVYWIFMLTLVFWQHNPFSYGVHTGQSDNFEHVNQIPWMSKITQEMLYYGVDFIFLMTSIKRNLIMIWFNSCTDDPIPDDMGTGSVSVIGFCFVCRSRFFIAFQSSGHMEIILLYWSSSTWLQTIVIFNTFVYL